MSRKITGINDIPTLLDQNKTNGKNEFIEKESMNFSNQMDPECEAQKEKHTITEWCLKLKISLIDTKYFEDTNKYTIKEFENIVPRNIQVPLPEEVSEYRAEQILSNTIEAFYDDKQQLDFYKKETDKQNKEIKEAMSKLNKTEFETDNGYIAKITVQKRENFNEDKLLAKIKDLGVEGIIKTKEYIDMDALEDAIYNERLNASELSNCRESKETITLRVSKNKE